MKYIDEFRNQELAQNLLLRLRALVTRPWVVMEVCGGQTHSIVKYGLDELLPKEIELAHGPGCPVCVTSLELIDRAHALARRPDVIFCSFGDMLRVPGSSGDLFQIRSQGGDVRVVYSPLDCLKLARANPSKRVVFFAIGFETTAPANAMSVWQARAQSIENYCDAGFARHRAAGHDRHSGIAQQPRAGVSGSGTRVRGDGVGGIRAAGGALPCAHRGDRVSSRWICWKGSSGPSGSSKRGATKWKTHTRGRSRGKATWRRGA